MTVTRQRWLEGQGGVDQEVRYRYDEAGRLIEQVQGAYGQRWTYDADGKLLREGWDYDGDGNLETWTDIEYDEAARWVSRATWSQGATTPHVQWRIFATCE